MKSTIRNFSGLAILIAFFASCAGPNIETIQYLKDPQVTLKADAKALTVKLTGAPGEISGAGFKVLYKAYYKLDTKFRIKNEAPRARWENLSDASGKKMTATFAVLVNDSLTELPQSLQAEYPDVKLVAWKYGEVAEILHIGSYGNEIPTVEKLQNFIKTKGYEISGFHEEEYYKGPGMIFKGDENNYHTIIRYQIKKVVK